jgi:hypothetical protein
MHKRSWFGNLARLFTLSALLFQAFACKAETPARLHSPAQRMETAHLQAVHEVVGRLHRARKAIPPIPGLHDYKAILHAHAEDSAHTGGTRPEMLADAERAGIQVIMLSDHFRPPRDFMRESWRGFHDGVLFIPGSEVRGFLVYPTGSIMDRMEQPVAEFISSVTASNGLIFLSHAEERLDHPMTGLNGMEIYNRHADAKHDKAGPLLLAMKLLKPKDLAELRDNLRLYPDELFAAQVSYLQDYIDKWDTETRTRRLTGVAANDCHHNMVLVVKMADEGTVRVGTNVDDDKSMYPITAETCPEIVELVKGHKPGDELVRVDLDPYERSFRNVTTHILAPELTESAIRLALQSGHAFVSHDWMCDATSFCFNVSSPKKAIMGDETPLAGEPTLVARFPVTCHIRLLAGGKELANTKSDRLEYPVKTPGAYRVEGWLSLDGEERPWIYSNPIYVR